MKQKNYAGIDVFRLAAAFMVIGIHTAPFSKISPELDFLLTYCIGRVAVPFFLMTTGYFVLAPYVSGGCCDTRKMRRFLLKNTGIYAAATALYIPASVYSGNFPGSVSEAGKQIFFDGTFYHLWYFPAVIMGCLILMLLLKKLAFHRVLFISAALYAVGLFGDSYYGVARMIPGIKEFYDLIFAVSSYTRNGIFYAPVFLMLGAAAAMPGRPEEKPGKEGNRGIRGRTPEVRKKDCRKKYAPAGAGMVVFTVLMLIEGYITYRYHLQRHNSMYLFLLPVSYCLFRLLLSVPGGNFACLRDVSMLIYILHPAVLIGLRGAAGYLNMSEILVENSLVQFLTVSAVSLAAAWILQMAAKQIFNRGGRQSVQKRESMD